MLLQEVAHLRQPGVIYLSEDIEARVPLAAVEKPCAVIQFPQALPPPAHILHQPHRLLFCCNFVYLSASASLTPVSGQAW